MKLIDRLERLGRHRHPQADPLPPRLPDHRHPLHQGGAAGDRALSTSSCASMGVDITHVDVGGGLGVDYDGTQLDQPRERELHAAGVRERRRLHARRGVPRERAADAAHHQRVGARAHRAPRAAAAQRDRRRVAGRAVAAGADARTTTRCCTRWRRTTRTLSGRLPQRGCARSSTTRRSTRSGRSELFNSGVLSPARARDGRADLPRDDERASPQCVGDDRAEYRGHRRRISTRRWSTGTSATSRSSSRCPDSWAIDQLFPIMPIHRLDEEPDRRGTLQDVTCDSDGKIDRFIGDKKGKPQPRAARVPRRRALHPRHLPDRRVPGDPRRPAQPVRRHERRAHPAHRTTATRSPTSCTATR